MLNFPCHRLCETAAVLVGNSVFRILCKYVQSFAIAMKVKCRRLYRLVFFILTLKSSEVIHIYLTTSLYVACELQMINKYCVFNISMLILKTQYLLNITVI